MANTLLTPTELTRETLRILHQKLNFIGTISRQYDDRFANAGAKIGDTLQIRLPNRYTVRTGRVIDVQDTTETKVDLVVSTQKGVDLEFTSVDLTMDIDRFADRYLEPAMSVLAAHIENDAMSMYKNVWNEVSDVDAAITLADVLKGLFNDPAKISRQYRDGMVANDFVGFENLYQNTMWPVHTTGTDDGTGDHLVDAASQTGATITHGAEGAGTLKEGDIITFAGCNRVHPETKVDTGNLHRFTVTADMASDAASVLISPAISTSGADQNCAASPDNAGGIFKQESDDSTAIPSGATSVGQYGITMGYHRDAFAFATADLVMPKGVDFAAREVFDGISLRIVRAYDINNDNFPCRMDILYGFKATRPELACRGGFN